jgi:hypothetical protein
MPQSSCFFTKEYDMRYIAMEEAANVSGGQDINIYIYGDVYTTPFNPGSGFNPCNGPFVPPAAPPILPINPSVPPINGPIVPPMPT